MRIWVTRSGESIPIKDMEDSHILNSIKFFENKGTRDLEIGWLKEERQKRAIARGEIVSEETGPIESRFDILDIRKVD